MRRATVDERGNDSGPESMSLEELKSEREALAQKFEYAMYRLEDSEKRAQKALICTKMPLRICGRRILISR
jgi:hypothetical protein